MANRNPAATRERRDFVEKMMLAFVPPRVIAKQASEKYGCQKATIYKDMSAVEKNWDKEAALLQDKSEWQRLKHQHVKSVQLAMAASIAKGQYNQFVRLSETYIKLMGFNKTGTEVKHVIQQQKEAVSKMSEEELAKLIKASGVELH
tara:strand:+ start:125 stop:565 length:441 start_codon:yes stop_codon:yes gene_type:complete